MGGSTKRRIAMRRNDLDAYERLGVSMTVLLGEPNAQVGGGVGVIPTTLSGRRFVEPSLRGGGVQRIEGVVDSTTDVVEVTVGVLDGAFDAIRVFVLLIHVLDGRIHFDGA